MRSKTRSSYSASRPPSASASPSSYSRRCDLENLLIIAQFRTLTLSSQQAQVPGLTESTLARQRDAKARLHFARAEALLELAKSKPLSASAATMWCVSVVLCSAQHSSRLSDVVHPCVCSVRRYARRKRSRNSSQISSLPPISTHLSHRHLASADSEQLHSNLSAQTLQQRGPEGTVTEFVLANFIKVQVAELMDPGNIIGASPRRQTCITF